MAVDSGVIAKLLSSLTAGTALSLSSPLLSAEIVISLSQYCHAIVVTLLSDFRCVVQTLDELPHEILPHSTPPRFSSRKLQKLSTQG